MVQVHEREGPYNRVYGDWLRPGVGAVATQAFAEPAYGPRYLEESWR